jgi:lipoate-protein ligase A
VGEPAPPWRGGWRLVERHGLPASLVASRPDPGGERLACLAHPTAAAVVLGSGQRESDVDSRRCARLGLAVVRRHSGGGAVLVVPGAQLWVDLFVPAADPLTDPDVVRAAAWVGALFRDAIADSSGDGDGLVVHAGRLAATAWSRQVCFSGIGPGEVTRDGRKLTGLAQRRSRAGAWFFTMALIRAEQRHLASLLAVGDEERRQLGAALDAGTAVVDCAGGELEAQLAKGLGGEWSAGEDVPAEPHPAERDDDPSGR